MASTPSAFEQYMLELINRARMNPAGEAAALIRDAAAGQAWQGNVTNAIGYFGVDLAAFAAQMAALPPVAPLAWNATLAEAADAHSALLIETDSQSHQVPGEAGLGARLSAAGYRYAQVAENVYSYTQDAVHGHAGFLIDWGYDDADYDAYGRLLTDWRRLGDGMQDHLGHRNTILNGALTEVGIGALAENDPDTAVGPWVVTQDFGTRRDYVPQVLGVVIEDADGDAFYDIGEGLGGVTITLQGQGPAITTQSWSSGGYQVEAAPGHYLVTFSGGGLAGRAWSLLEIGDENVKLDLTGDQAALDAVAGQVYRLYQTVLGRAPDMAGHTDWSARLSTGHTTLDAAAAGFVASREFRQVYGALDDEGFVTALYRNVLDRAPDAAGLQNWTAELAGGAARAEVVLGFSESAEFMSRTGLAAAAFGREGHKAGWTDDVYRLYHAVLGRNPDMAGLEDWAGRLAEGMTYDSAVDGFVASREFQLTYGETSDEAFVTLLYQNVLDRAPEARGLQTWTTALETGTVDRAGAVAGFAQSLEFIAASTPGLEAFMRTHPDDLLSGGAGTEVLFGGFGADTFRFAPGTGSSGTVLGFEAWDLLDLTGFGYEDLETALAQFVEDGGDLLFADQATEILFADTRLDLMGTETLLL